MGERSGVRPPWSDQAEAGRKEKTRRTLGPPGWEGHAAFALGVGLSRNNEFERGFDIGVELHGDFEFTGALDRFLQHDVVAVHGEFGLIEQGLGEVGGGDRAEGLAALAGGDLEVDGGFAERGGGFLGSGDFGSLAGGAFGLEGVGPVQVAFGRFQGQALGQEVIAGESAADFDEVGFGAEPGDFFGENDLDAGHGSAFVEEIQGPV